MLPIIRSLNLSIFSLTYNNIVVIFVFWFLITISICNNC